MFPDCYWSGSHRGRGRDTDPWILDGIMHDTKSRLSMSQAWTPTLLSFLQAPLIYFAPATLAFLVALKHAERVAFCLCPGSSLCLFPPVPCCQLLPISQLDCQLPLVALFHLIQFSSHSSHSLLNTSLSLLSMCLPEILLFLVMCYLFTYMFTVSFRVPQQKVEIFRGRID